MKKTILVTLLAIITFAFCGCGASSTDLALENLAEVRYNIFSGENDTYVATFMSGKRENPYVVNGVCEKQVEFGMVTVKYRLPDMPTVAQYELTIGENTFKGNFEYNAYESTLMVDIQKVVSDDAQITLKVITNQDEKTCALQPQTKGMEITWRTALDIAIKSFGADFDAYISKGRFNGEVYVKIITDLNGNFDDYYWYVSVVGTNGKTCSVIINPQSGEVIAKNC